MFIDTHAHLNFSYYKKNIDEIVKNAFSKNVKKIINIGSNYKTSLEAIRIATNFNKKKIKNLKECDEFGIYASVGLHPIHTIQDITENCVIEGKKYHFTTKKEVFDYKKYYKLAKNKKVVAIGETGLDFYYFDEKNQKSEIKNITKLQKDVFVEHIKLAKELALPMILHCRGSKKNPYKAYDFMIKILEDQKYFRGIVHCFTGNIEQAKKFIKLGFYLGINGIVTFNNAKELQEIIRNVELKNLVLETDCPFLAPVPFRGEQNEPAFIPLIAQKIAELKKTNIIEVEQTLTANANRIFYLH